MQAFLEEAMSLGVLTPIPDFRLQVTTTRDAAYLSRVSL